MKIAHLDCFLERLEREIAYIGHENIIQITPTEYGFTITYIEEDKNND